jgi:hypothetical protein
MKVEKILAMALLLAVLTCGDEALEVSINYPDDEALVSGILRIVADASDNVVSVSFYTNDSCLGVAQAAPFVHIWNTFIFPDSSSHIIYAIAEDRKGNEVYSDSVSVLVYNGNVVFADDFEWYLPGTYPDAGWFEIWLGAGSNHTYVDSIVANNGIQSFRLRGLMNWVRTDGVELALHDIQQLTYETSLMIPSDEPTGALFGFFMLLNPQLGTIYNGVWFSQADSSIYARGAVEDSTGHTWTYDTWYSVKVTLSYAQLEMNVWVDNEQIVFGLPAVPRDWTDTFALATEYGKAGVVYYDDINIYETGDSVYSCPVP